MKHHPIADLFPMLPEDELKELAADIKERGLLQPIVLDGEGRILDGRNRYAACELVGVDPVFVTYDGDDAEGFAWSINVRRRNLTKGQIALAAADRFADKDLSTRLQAEAAGVSQPMIVWAQVVRRYPDLHAAVLDATESLKPAYVEAQRRDAIEERRKTDMARLRDLAPDLVALVDDEELSLDDAIAALNARQSKETQERLAAEAEQRRLRDEAQTESSRAVTRFSAIAGQLIGSVTPSEWGVGEDDWSVFLQAVKTVSQWKDKEDGEA